MAVDQTNTDLMLRRVEGYTSGLPQAVRAPSSAEFGMLLSLIASTYEKGPTGAAQPNQSGGEFKLPAKLEYINPDSLFNTDLVKRLNHSVTEQQRGEFAYLVSYLKVKAETPIDRPIRNDRFAQLSLASLGGQMLEQITAAREGFQAVA
ncbi:hypothetical protein [Nitrincola schmidtii]|uniref:hypothetical protein n=1 Tax=Nitrincola schmidtii TaxID=1730894 RepID=UPI00124C53D0|nr:hypothetical protein [Nitrincola schmidtii]